MFWDSSALVPLLVGEARSGAMLALLREDSEPTLWWGSAVECTSALYRRHREKPIPSPLLRQALLRLDGLVEDSDVVAASTAVAQRARRLLASHAIRASDALQLAAALVWSREDPRDVGFVSLDDRLRDSALREGFVVLPG